MIQHPHILDRQKTALLVIDVQEAINAVMHTGDLVVESVVKLIKACKILSVPIFITEQYPKGLGPTETKVREVLGDQIPIQKMSFSCCHSDDLVSQLRAVGAKQVIVAGIESHVCVLQTALDLIAMGFQVHLPKEATSSRKEMDYLTALERMQNAGVIITTVEASLFELLEEAGTPEFREVSRLIK